MNKIIYKHLIVHIFQTSIMSKTVEIKHVTKLTIQLIITFHSYGFCEI